MSASTPLFLQRPKGYKLFILLTVSRAFHGAVFSLGVTSSASFDGEREIDGAVVLFAWYCKSYIHTQIPGLESLGFLWGDVLWGLRILMQRMCPCVRSVLLYDVLRHLEDRIGVLYCMYIYTPSACDGFVIPLGAGAGGASSARLTLRGFEMGSIHPQSIAALLGLNEASHTRHVVLPGVKPFASRAYINPDC